MKKTALLLFSFFVYVNIFSQSIDTTDIYYQSLLKYLSFNKSNTKKTHYFNYNNSLQERLPSCINGYDIKFVHEKEQKKIIQEKGGITLYFFRVDVVNNQVEVYIGNHGISKESERKVCGGGASFFYEYNCAQEIFILKNYEIYTY